MGNCCFPKSENRKQDIPNSPLLGRKEETKERCGQLLKENEGLKRCKDCSV
jgi:hypothetical protein